MFLLLISLVLIVICYVYVFVGAWNAATFKFVSKEIVSLWRLGKGQPCAAPPDLTKEDEINITDQNSACF